MVNILFGKNKYCNNFLIHAECEEGPSGRMAYAEDCKSFYIGSIPVSASLPYAFLTL